MAVSLWTVLKECLEFPEPLTTYMVQVSHWQLTAAAEEKQCLRFRLMPTTCRDEPFCSIWDNEWSLTPDNVNRTRSSVLIHSRHHLKHITLIFSQQHCRWFKSITECRVTSSHQQKCLDRIVTRTKKGLMAASSIQPFLGDSHRLNEKYKTNPGSENWWPETHTGCVCDRECVCVWVSRTKNSDNVLMQMLLRAQKEQQLWMETCYYRESAGGQGSMLEPHVNQNLGCSTWSF